MPGTLHEFLALHRDAILARAKELLVTRTTCPPREEELALGMPLFFEQLTVRLRGDGCVPPGESPALETSAEQRGGALFHAGFTITHVVHAYGAICQASMALAEERRQEVEPREFMALNLALDNAIAVAVGEFQLQTSRQASRQHIEHLGMLAHELRNSLTTLVMAFGIVKRGVVAPGGSTGAIIDAGLARMRNLIDRALTEVRMHEKMPLCLEQVQLSAMIDQVLSSLAPDAEAREVALEARVAPGVVLNADPQLLASVIANLVLNAIKYTRPRTVVVVQGQERDGKVRIEVEDCCGGLPAGMTDSLFRPFSRHSSKCTGLGLGLAVVKQAIDAHGGRVGVRDLPGKGCVFTVDLPMKAPPRVEHAARGSTSPQLG